MRLIDADKLIKQFDDDIKIISVYRDTYMQVEEHGKQVLDKVNIELKNLFTRKDKYIKAQALYEIKDEI